MILQRFSSWSFAALRGQKRCSPPPFVDRPKYDLAKVFFVVLRGPSWIKKVFSPPPFVDSPNNDLANLSSDKRQPALKDALGQPRTSICVRNVPPQNHRIQCRTFPFGGQPGGASELHAHSGTPPKRKMDLTQPASLWYT